jgi:hypothetical protein
MNINSRLAVALTLAISTALISTAAKAQSLSVEDQKVVQLDRHPTIQKSKLNEKIKILQPGGVHNGGNSEAFVEGPPPDQFKEKPGFADFTKQGRFQDRINPGLKVRPSAVGTFKAIGH